MRSNDANKTDSDAQQARTETLIESAAIGTAKDLQLKAALEDLDKKFQVSGVAGSR